MEKLNSQGVVSGKVAPGLQDISRLSSHSLAPCFLRMASGWKLSSGVSLPFRVPFPKLLRKLPGLQLTILGQPWLPQAVLACMSAPQAWGWEAALSRAQKLSAGRAETSRRGMLGRQKCKVTVCTRARGAERTASAIPRRLTSPAQWPLGGPACMELRQL